ncbi:MAG: DNA topoisomerase 4 subunit A [Anaerolineae bacterium]|nr:DNA topoisomerase 4 subunit A [Anaerolineae bacterium]
MELGLVRKIDIDTEMQQSYLDYAMSVIVSRALPDARDGMKPVQRRILYAMYDMGLRADSTYKKSARIVGEVLGKYHPHGDSAVYEAMARLAQDFSMRTMLVDGQGNFGSIDGDPPAAMRYTEARLSPAALDILLDINKNTVDFATNFDDTLTEPTVLPAAIPNLLVNGATGIAVGMATSIPPHNLGEISDALIYMLQHWEKLDDIDVSQLMRFVKGPDFPTGGVIIESHGDQGIETAYGTGRGKVTVQARAHLEEMERGKNRIIVTELPYQTNKSSLIERIAELARDGHLDGVSDLRDESDRQGMRIVIELTKNADPEAILRDLYKRTPMQSTFSIILLALVDGEPRMLSLKQALRVYVEHRLTVIRRRAEYDLAKAKARAHILEGYLVALKNLDEIIDLIKKSPDVETARERLMKRYKLTDLQANAILEMQLRRLAALERKKIETEYKELQALIKELETLLKSPVKMRAMAAEELLKVKAAYADRRRTQIVSLEGGKEMKSLLTSSDLLPEESVWVSMDKSGMISRTSEDKSPRLSGIDAPAFLVRGSTHDTLYLAAANGKSAAVAVHTLPESPTPFNKVCPLKADEKPACAFVLPAQKSSLPEETYVFTTTRGGMVKKSLLGELPGPSAQTFWLCKVNDGDALGWVSLTDGKRELLLATALGMAIRFDEDEVRPMGLVAAGVNAVKLGVGDEVTGAEVINGLSHETTDKNGFADVFLIGSDGKAKRVALKDFPSQGRYGRGVIAWDLPLGIKLAGIATGKPNSMVTIHLLKAAAKSARLDEAGLKKRAATRGDVVTEVKPGDAVLGLVVAWSVERFLGGGKGPAKHAPTVDSGKPQQLSLLSPPKEKKTADKERTTTDTVKTPAAKAQKTAGKGSTTKAAAAKKPAAKAGAAKTPAKKTPAAKAPAIKPPAAKTPAKKKPAAKTPAAKAPAAKKPASKN